MALREVAWISLIVEFDDAGEIITGVRLEINPSNDPDSHADRVQRFDSLSQAGIALAMEGTAFAAAGKVNENKTRRPNASVVEEAERILKEGKS